MDSQVHRSVDGQVPNQPMALVPSIRHGGGMQPVISVSDLHMTYAGGTVAVAGIDFSVHSGEVYALLGPNGAGKTTTVEILEGFRKRTGGDTRVLGIDPASPTRQWRDRVGIVLQTSGTSDEVTVAELLTLQARYHAILEVSTRSSP